MRGRVDIQGDGSGQSKSNYKVEAYQASHLDANQKKAVVDERGCVCLYLKLAPQYIRLLVQRF